MDDSFYFYAKDDIVKNKKWLNKNVTAMGFTSLCSDTSHEMATSILPAFLTELVGASAPQLLGLITGLSDLLSSAAKMLSGWLSDKLKKRKPLIVFGYFLTGLFMGLIGFARNWIEILIYKTLGWIGRGTREPPRDALLSESVDKKFYGHAFGFHRAMDSLGAIIGPLLAFFLVPLIGFRNIFFLSFIPGMLSVIVILKIKEKRRKYKNQNKSFILDIKSLPKEFKKFLFIMFIFGIGNFHKSLLILKVQQSLTPTSGIIIAASFAVLFYTIRNFAQAVSDYIVGGLSDKISKKILLSVFGFSLFGLASLGFIYTTTSFSYFIILFILSGVSASGVAIEKAYAAELLPDDVRGTGYGILNTVDGMGDFISSFVVGTVWTILSPSIAFTYGAIISFIAAFLLLSMMKK